MLFTYSPVPIGKNAFKYGASACVAKSGHVCALNHHHVTCPHWIHLFDLFFAFIFHDFYALMHASIATDHIDHHEDSSFRNYSYHYIRA
jgi:hypothetical protein